MNTSIRTESLSRITLWLLAVFSLLAHPTNAAALELEGCGAGTEAQNFTFTGAPQTFTVPNHVTRIFVEVKGAQGGAGASSGTSAGGVGAQGGVASGILNVTPGQVLNIFVGGQGGAQTGGFNGGGTGGVTNAGGGGGASDIRIGGTGTANRIIVAGGGGGGGRAGAEESLTGTATGGAGGLGGGGNGANGANVTTSGGTTGGGRGGIGIDGGAAGIGCPGFLGVVGSAATGANGGAGGGGQGCCIGSTASAPGGGGGGGGFLGGGGGGGGSAGTTGCSGNGKGAGGGGAGGTNFVDAAFVSSESLSGGNSGNGSVRICYLVSQADTVFVVSKKPTLIDVIANDPKEFDLAALTIVTPPTKGTAKVVGNKILYTSNSILGTDTDTFTYNYEGNATVTVRDIGSFAGTYDGTFTSPLAMDPKVLQEQSGFIRMTVGKTGAFTGSLFIGGRKFTPVVRTSFAGSTASLLPGGGSVRVVVRKPEQEVVLRFQLDPVTRVINATVESTDSASNAFNRPAILLPQLAQGGRAGLYTMRIDSDLFSTGPQGAGFASVKIGTTGLVSTVGKTADSTPFTCGSGLNLNNAFSLYSGLYKGTPAQLGSLRGIIVFGPVPFGDASGSLTWIKPLRTADTMFPGGFALERIATVSRYNPPVPDSFALNFQAGKANGLMRVTSGILNVFDQPFTLSPSNVTSAILPSANKVVLKLNAKNGTYTGTFLHPTTLKLTPFAGAIRQQDAMGYGYWLGTAPSQSGTVTLQAAP